MEQQQYNTLGGNSLSLFAKVVQAHLQQSYNPISNTYPEKKYVYVCVCVCVRTRQETQTRTVTETLLMIAID